jgi:hypothetical protein
MPGPKPKPNAGPMVFMLHYSHKHGDDFGAYGSRAAAERARAALCVEYADEVYIPNAAPSAEETIAARIRELFTEGKFEECSRLYLEHVEGEHMEIHQLEVTGLQSIDTLIERSSLGTPDAVAVRAGADPTVVAKILARVEELDRLTAVQALRAVLPFFHPEITRGPAIERWVKAARLLIAAFPGDEDVAEIRDMLDRCGIPVEVE